ncbi:MAG: hypothetical protein V4615_02830 [Bacteroidota bacterium]
MKKVLLLLVGGVLISTSMISCSSKCGHCEVNGSSGPEYCSSKNHAVYDAAVSSCVAGSGTWVTK